MKKLFYFFAAVVTALTAATANAADAPGNRDRWLCSTCELSPPRHAMTADDLGDSWAFIRGTVNTSTGSSWKQNEMVTICDGSSCLLLSFQAIGCGCWMPVGPTIKDNGQGYKNGQATKKVRVNGDTATPINSWYIWLSYWDFSQMQARLVTPTVTIIQSSQAASLGFESSFSSGYELGSSASSYSYGGDTLVGGYDLYEAAYSTNNSNQCYGGTCNHFAVH